MRHLLAIAIVFLLSSCINQKVDLIWCIDADEFYSENDIRNIFIQNYHILESNRKKLIEHYCKIMNDINVLLLQDKKIKLI